MCSSISDVELLTVVLYVVSELVSYLVILFCSSGANKCVVTFYLTHLEKASLKGNFCVFYYYLRTLIFNLKELGNFQRTLFQSIHKSIIIVFFHL